MFLWFMFVGSARCQKAFSGRLLSEYEEPNLTVNATLEVDHYEGTFRTKLVWHHDSSKCLDVKDHRSFNGNTIQLWDCLDGDDDQYFLLPSFAEDKGNFGKIRWSKDPKMCLDVKDHKDFDGNVLQLWECFDDDADQNFMTPSEYAYAPIKWANHGEKCVDVKNQLSDNGNVIQIWGCDAENTFHDFERSTCHLDNECIDDQGHAGVCCEIGGMPVCDRLESCLPKPSCHLRSECTDGHGQAGVCCEIDGKPMCDPSESCLPQGKFLGKSKGPAHPAPAR